MPGGGREVWVRLVLPGEAPKPQACVPWVCNDGAGTTASVGERQSPRVCQVTAPSQGTGWTNSGMCQRGDTAPSPRDAPQQDSERAFWFQPR